MLHAPHHLVQPRIEGLLPRHFVLYAEPMSRGWRDIGCSSVNDDMRHMRHPLTILFAEDDRPVRDSVIEILRAHGFNVLVAQDGYEAIRLLVEHSVDLLFTDIVMPGISGFELAQQAKLIRPHLRVLYMTGYTYAAPGQDGPRYGKLLYKPLRAEEILSEVEQTLAD